MRFYRHVMPNLVSCVSLYIRLWVRELLRVLQFSEMRKSAMPRHGFFIFPVIPIGRYTYLTVNHVLCISKFAVRAGMKMAVNEYPLGRNRGAL